jgi:hypothetical protein
MIDGDRSADSEPHTWTDVAEGRLPWLLATELHGDRFVHSASRAVPCQRVVHRPHCSRSTFSRHRESSVRCAIR